jgi:hypothetical protein
VQRDVQTIPQRFDDAWRLGTRPARAICGVLLDVSWHPVIGTLQRPQLGGGGFGIRVTAIRLPGGRARGGLQGRVGRLDRTLQVLLAPLILAAGVDHHGPRGLAREGDATLSHFRAGPWTVLCRLRLREPPALLPWVTRDRLRHDPSTCAVRGGEAGDAEGVPEGREIVLRHQSRIGNGAIGARLHSIVRAKPSALG